MSQVFITENEHAVSVGAKHRFRWKTRRTLIQGPPQRREVWLVVETPRYNERISVSIPSSYRVDWYLECGHRILPMRRMDAHYGDKNPYMDPETAWIFCETCRRKLDTWKEERYKEWYWDYKHTHKLNQCQECKCCLECESHKAGCTQPTREYLMELIMEPKDREDLWDNVNALVELLDSKQLTEAIGVYNEQ